MTYPRQRQQGDEKRQHICELGRRGNGSGTSRHRQVNTTVSRYLSEKERDAEANPQEHRAQEKTNWRKGSSQEQGSFSENKRR